MRVTHVIRVISPTPIPCIIFVPSVVHVMRVIHVTRVMRPTPFLLIIFFLGVMCVMRVMRVMYFISIMSPTPCPSNLLP